MNLSALPDPTLSDRVLIESFKEMTDAEYQKTLDSTIERGNHFSQQDDSGYVATLTEEERLQYAATCALFLKNLKALRQNKNHRLISSIFLAKTIAWWNYLSAFRTMVGKEPAHQSS